MNAIYRKVTKGGLLRAGDEVVSHDGKGWVFGVVASIDTEKATADIVPTTRPMLSIEEAGKQADKEASWAVRNARRAGVDLAESILSSQDVEIKEFDHGGWPSLDRTERRSLDDYDPLARAIRKRLFPERSSYVDQTVWLTTEFITGGYSDYTAEQEYGLIIECGKYTVHVGDGESRVPLDTLLDWLDGKDAGVRVVTKEAA